MSQHQGPMQPTSAIIINWNTRKHLLRCVESFISDGLQQSSILAVDQGSTDGSLEAVQAKFPGIRTLSIQENIGYAHAVNRGVAEIHDPLIVIANADVIVHKGAIRSMAEVMQTDERIGMLGCRVLDSGGRNATRFSRTSVTRGILLEFTPRFLRNLWRDPEQFARQRQTPSGVTFVEGAFFMIRRDSFVSVGKMDEGFTFFFEDADLSHRMIDSGFRIEHVPEASVTHYGGASFEQVTQRQAATFFQNMVRFYIRHALRRALWLGRMIPAIASSKAFLLKVFFPVIGAGADVKSRIERNRTLLQSLVQPIDQLEITDAPTLVSVIVPTYNRPDSVRILLEALRNQTYANHEIIVLDQSDNGNESAKESSSPEVRWMKLKRANRSLAKNAGISEAKGDILLFCDDDIIPENTMIDVHVQAHADSSVGGVSCRVAEEGLQPMTSKDICRVTPYGRMKDGFQSNVECYVETLVGANMSLKRGVMREAGYFDALFIGTSIFEEQDLSERIRHLGFKILFTNKSSVQHTPHPDGNVGLRGTQTSTYYHDFHHNELIFFLKNRNRLLLLLVIPFCFLRTLRQSVRYRLSFREGMHIFAGVVSGIRAYYRSMK